MKSNPQFSYNVKFFIVMCLLAVAYGYYQIKTCPELIEPNCSYTGYFFGFAPVLGLVFAGIIQLFTWPKNYQKD